LRDVEKYPSIIGLKPGTLALLANMLTNFAEMKDKTRYGSQAILIHGITVASISTRCEGAKSQRTLKVTLKKLL